MLLGEFQKRREARMPRALFIAQQVLDTMIVPAFAGTIGIRAWDLSREEMGRLLRVDGAKPFDKWSLRSGFHMDLVVGRAQPPAKSTQASGIGGGAVNIPGARIVASK